MKYLISLPILALSVACAQPAWATPDDMITVEDEVFAASADTLFVMRTVQDNLGLHMSTYSETFLVAIDAATAEERHWLVYRARQDRLFNANLDDERVETTVFDPDEWHNPYAIVAEAGASLAPVAIRGGDQPITVDLMNIANPFGGQFAFRAERSVAHARLSLVSVQRHSAGGPRQSMLTTQDIWEERQVDWDSCAFAKVGYPTGIGRQAFQIVRITCDDGYDGNRTSLLQALPQVGVRGLVPHHQHEDEGEESSAQE